MMFSASGEGHSAEPDWSDDIYDYVTVEQPLVDVLRELASFVGVPVRISEEIGETVVRGRLPALPARPFLDQLAMLYGLIWYFDGITLYVYSLDEVASRVIKLQLIDPLELEDALRELNILDRRYPWAVSEDFGIIYLSGPPRYVELIGETAALLEDSREVRTEIRTFPLRYAPVEDRTFNVRGEAVQLTGVATILRNLLQQPETEQETVRAEETTVSTGDPFEAEAVGRELLKVSGPDPVVQSDPRLNTVIIRDASDSMPLYERLIQIIDQPVRQVEIEVQIIDVNTSRLEELGVDWRFSTTGNDRVDVGIGNPANDPDTLVSGPGFVINTLITGDAFDFLARIRALEQQGDARVLSRPAVVTFDNLTAVFDQRTTFFVRLEGQEDVELEEIEFGTLLRVRPHVIDELNDQTSIQLTIDVEDGTTTTAGGSDTVDDIPVISTSQISTAAIVQDRQALVIGGFVRQTSTQSVSKVPLLGDIPYIGWTFFRTTTDNLQDTVRLFVIRPEVITLDPIEGLANADLLDHGGPVLLTDRRLPPAGRFTKSPGIEFPEDIRDISSCISRRALSTSCDVERATSARLPADLLGTLY